MQRVIIVGAGAMGCFFAARLAEAGDDVTLIDVDDARLAALRADGITIDDALGKRVVRINAARAAAVAGLADLLILFTKGVHTEAAAETVRHLIGPDSRALTLQNGVGNADAIATVIPATRILVGVTDIPCDLTGPTSVSSHGSGNIVLGNFAGDDTGSAEAVVSQLRAAGLSAGHDPAVQIAIWEKIAFNAAMNALCTLTRLPVGGLRSDPGERLVTAIRDEVVTVAHATGIAVDAARIDAKIRHALANHTTHKPSMLQDRLAGRVTEIETINGAVVRAAEAAAVDAPVNRTVADLIRAQDIAIERNLL